MECPGCCSPMKQKRLDAKYGGQVAIDLCFACHGIWFDGSESGSESLQLTPGAVLRLLRTIHDHRDEPRRPLAEGMRCPRCPSALAKTHDMQRNTRFVYLRCGSNHGRFITFHQFLREKNVARNLDVRQLAELRRHVKVIMCSHCGAPVELERSMACEHCRAAISVLDPSAIHAALSDLQQQEVARSSVDPNLPMQLLTDQLKVESTLGRRRGLDTTIDLIDLGVDAVMDIVRRVL